jgi:hypothetical protein
MNRRGVVAGSAIGLVGILTGCVSKMGNFGDEMKSRTEHQTHEVGSGTHLLVRNRNGPVTVEGYDGSAVEVDIEIRAPSSDALAAVSVNADQTGNELTLETVYENTPDHQEASVRLTIRCPADVLVQQVQTIHGSVEITNAAGDPTLESQNGSLTVRNVDGMVSLTTSNGEITAREIGGVTGATTSNGSIAIDVPAIEGDVVIRTRNGSIDASLATDLNVDISATTSHNSVDIHSLELSSAQVSQTSVSGVLGSGTHDLSFETNNGSIDLRTLSG